VGQSETLRLRICGAAVALVGEVGYARMTVERVVRLSGVSQETFHQHFDDLDGCLLAAFEDARERIAAVVVPAYVSESEWPAKVRAAVASLLAAMEDEPAISMFVFVGALGAGPKVLACRMQALERLKVAFEHGIDEAGGADAKEVAESSPLSAEGAVNGALGILHTRLLEGSPLARRPLSELAGPLTAMIVLPFVGHVPAGSSTSNGAGASNGVAAESNRHNRSGRADKILQGVQTRVSERAFRVLAVIDELDGRGSSPSNREIRDAAEITDSAQVSKLMKRLVRLGLVENTGAGRLTGKPYAWRLTTKGRELLRELEGKGVGAAASSPPTKRRRGSELRPKPRARKRKRFRLNAKQRALLAALQDGPRTVRELVHLTGMADQAVRNNAKGLLEREKVSKTERAGRIAYELPSKGRAAAGPKVAAGSSSSDGAGSANGAGSSSSNGAGALAATTALGDAGTSTSNGAGPSTNGQDRSVPAKAILQGLETPINEREFKLLAAIDELDAQGSSPSNREIGNATQIYNPTQLSKLIQRLAQLWLVQKDATGKKPFGWRLTTKGIELLHTIEGQAVGGTHPADARA
jgi:AcrR family transcriptional regulator